MITEKYRSPSYRPELVTHRFVRYMVAGRYRVFECCAKRKAKNRTAALNNVGAGPTIREYECDEGSLPISVARRALESRQIVAWS